MDIEIDDKFKAYFWEQMKESGDSKYEVDKVCGDAIINKLHLDANSSYLLNFDVEKIY
jgi:hypothetical protein